MLCKIYFLCAHRVRNFINTTVIESKADMTSLL